MNNVIELNSRGSCTMHAAAGGRIVAGEEKKKRRKEGKKKVWLVPQAGGTCDWSRLLNCR